MSGFSINSRVDPNLIIAIIHSPTTKSKREDLLAESQNLQISAITLDEYSGVKPHKHLPIQRQTVGTAEAWVIIRGSVNVLFFDLDDSLLGEFEVKSGELVVTLAGGHSIQCTSSQAFLYEIKNGPYKGEHADRVRIN